jgi:Sec-independent protein translocase protein TatA
MEIAVVAILALISLWARELPEIGRKVGETAAGMRRTASEVKEEFQIGV